MELTIFYGFFLMIFYAAISTEVRANKQLKATEYPHTLESATRDKTLKLSGDYVWLDSGRKGKLSTNRWNITYI